MTDIMTSLDSPSESFFHKAMKELIFKTIPKHDHNILESSKEKYFKENRGDVYFKLRGNQEVVVEVQHSKISVKEIKKRTSAFTKKGIHTLWILNGSGKCVGAPKQCEHRKKVRISTAEKFLHSLYGGRVYYMNLHKKADKWTITPPFALHYSLPTRLPSKPFKHGYDTIYLRNVNFASIPNWNLTCSTFKGYKIARFYDKNVKSSLTDDIYNFINRFHGGITDFSKSRKTKKLIKLLFQQLTEIYGEHLILDCILKLSTIKSINIHEKAFKTQRKQCSFK